MPKVSDDVLREAHEIQMRRHWHATYNPEFGKWKISEWCARGGEFLKWVRSHLFDDPAMCLVEAEKWYCANVEKVPV